ncbi:MAG: class I SAM-dependent methyltransferase [Proteobacteria bacterium]|nr:class I SAM-dependent methyltransferase [Pseudomonadota bacterium]
MIESLLFPYRRQHLPWLRPGARVLFLNAQEAPELKDLSVVAVQPRYDLAAPLLERGCEVQAGVEPSQAARFDTVWLLPGKDQQETQYWLAQAVMASKTGGTLVAAAPNNAGGKRLKNLFEKLGLAPSEESKNKARVVFATVDAGWNRSQAAQWRERGQEQAVMAGTIISRPGLHSWDKADAGSELLARHLPRDLGGAVADFGCGWGYLSLCAAKQAPHIQNLTVVDVDARAVRLAEKNIHRQYPSLPVHAVWTDLTRPDVQLGPFEVILLNPPFHLGTRAVPALGQVLITAAARMLAPAGRLYLVANRHLPYEKTLQTRFSQVELVTEEGGFKVMVCRR